MNTEATILAPQTRLMLSQASTLTEGQDRDWLGILLKKLEFKEIVQQRLNDAGLPLVEYSILMNFGRMLERVLFMYRGPALAQELERLIVRWCSRGMDHVKVQRLAVYCWDTLAQKAGYDTERGGADTPEVHSMGKGGDVIPRERAGVPLRSGSRKRHGHKAEARTT